MSNLSLEDDEGPMLKTRQRRVPEPSATPTSAPLASSSSSSPSWQTSPSLDTQSLSPQHARRKGSESGAATPARTRSILNLTSSTLFGIYQPTGYDINQDAATPWGTGAQTPIDAKPSPLDIADANFPPNELRRGPDGKILRRKSNLPPSRIHRSRRGFRGYFLPLAARTVTLAIAGVLYGLLISHLHDHQHLAPVQVDLDRSSRRYLVFWAIAGVILGEAFPRVDMLWESDHAIEAGDADEDQETRTARGAGSWNEVVRSIGAFVGIAFAIRKLPWQSTLQLSLTLAMANPALWYIIDRSPPGFALSTVVSLCGTAAVLAIYPGLIPSPTPSNLPWNQIHNQQGLVNATRTGLDSEQLILGLLSEESIGVTTWIASVLFVSSVCFGNIGRRLAPNRR